MSVECDRIGGINLAQGVCDTEVPATVAAAAVNAIHAGLNIYTRLDGISLLREAIAAKLASTNGMQCDPNANVLVTSGATGGFLAACLALLNPGDEVVLFEPFYGYHRNTLLSLRVQPSYVRLEGNDWSFDESALRAAITSRTRAILVNTPGNPTGKVFSRRELELIAEIAIEHDLLVFTDEIYEYFLYDGAEHISLAAFPGMAERTITISGFSKTFSITGWRLGYLAASAKWIPAIGYFHDLVYVCAPSPLQHGATAGLLHLPGDFYRQIAREHESKRDRLCSALSDAGLTPSVPAGAYYVLADVTKLDGASAKEKARTLLAKTGVAAVAGSAFYNGGGEDQLRFCFAKKDGALDEACRALRTLAD
jgi:aminotransferase